MLPLKPLHKVCVIVDPLTNYADFSHDYYLVIFTKANSHLQINSHCFYLKAIKYFGYLC